VDGEPWQSAPFTDPNVNIIVGNQFTFVSNKPAIQCPSDMPLTIRPCQTQECRLTFLSFADQNVLNNVCYGGIFVLERADLLAADGYFVTYRRVRTLMGVPGLFNFDLYLTRFDSNFATNIAVLSAPAVMAPPWTGEFVLRAEVGPVSTRVFVRVAGVIVMDVTEVAPDAKRCGVFGVGTNAVSSTGMPIEPVSHWENFAGAAEIPCTPC
jgi:hypothetical protein